MRENRTRRWSTYESFYIEIGTKKVADIHITAHAEKRWEERVTQSSTGMQHIEDYLWNSLQRSAVKMYYQGEEEAYIIDDDLVFIADFTESDHEKDLLGNALHCMHVITFLGHLSEVVQLRDLKTYYAWLRHNRKMNLLKNSRTIK